MNTPLKQKLAFGLVLLGIGLVGIRKAEAIGPNPDSMVVSVTPGNPQYGVYITSPIAGAAYGYDFKTVNMGLTTQSTLPIVVKSSGTVSEYFAMSIVDYGASPWTALGADGIPALDEFELLGHFSSGQPLLGGFSATDDIITGSIPGTVGTTYYNQGARTAPGTSQNLWLKLKMPASVTTATGRNLVLSINGQPN
jgi:hypothetical protein